jgi:hypothetical protein
MRLRAFLVRASATLYLAAFLAAVGSGTNKGSDPFLFENIAERAGLKFRQINFATGYKYPFETLGGAVAALDYDNDGRVDLFFLNGAPPPDTSGRIPLHSTVSIGTTGTALSPM